MSAYGTLDIAMEAMKLGAYDYISKPFKPDEIILTLRKAEEREQLRREKSTSKKKRWRKNIVLRISSAKTRRCRKYSMSSKR
jgi:two-component system response regulator AtoC